MQISVASGAGDWALGIGDWQILTATGLDAEFRSTAWLRKKSARISFATPELLWQVLTVKRWGLLKVLCGAGPVSIREAARESTVTSRQCTAM